MDTVLIAIGYALVGLVVAILATRWFMDEPGLRDDGPWMNGLAGLGAGVFWPASVVIFAMCCVGRGIAWLAGAR